MTRRNVRSDEKLKVRGFLSDIGLIASTQVIVQFVANLLELSRSVSASLGLAVFLLTMLALMLNRGKRREKKIPSNIRLYKLVLSGACGFAIAVIIFLLGLIVRDAREVRANKVVFYADALTLGPITDSVPGHYVRVPLNAQHTEWGTIPVYQEIIYWISYELDWHLSGSYWNFARASGGHVKPDVLYPKNYELTSCDTTSSLPGVNTIVWYESIPLKGVNTVLLRHDNYNCFFRDNHPNLGFTLRLPAEQVWVVWDFSRLNKMETFDLSYRPRILLERKLYVQEDSTATSLWSQGILRAYFENLEANDKIILDCRWAYTKKSKQGFPNPLLISSRQSPAP